MWCALSIVFSVSNESRASTSVDTRPGMISRILRPNATARRSIAWLTTASGFAPFASRFASSSAPPTTSS